jgi:T-complex protein 10 C-terminus
MAQRTMTPLQSRTPAPRESILKSVERFAQLADTPIGDISRLLSLSEGGDSPELPPSQELQELAEYMKNLTFLTPRPRQYHEPSLPRPSVEKPPLGGVFRDRSNMIAPPSNDHGTKKARDPTPCKQPPPLPQRLPSLDGLAGLKLVQSPSGGRMDQSSLIVEISHNEEEDVENTRVAKSPARTMPLEPDQARSPVQEPSILLGATDDDDPDRLLVRPRQGVVSNNDNRMVEAGQDRDERDDHYFLFAPDDQTCATTMRPNRLSLHLPTTPTLMVDSQLLELESTRPQTPQDARQWLQTAIIALQDARHEREAARQWARDMKEAVNKWAAEQQRLVQLEASSHLCDALQHLESLIVDLKSQVQTHQEHQDSAQSHLHELLQEQQAKLQDLVQQLPRPDRGNEVDFAEPTVTPTTHASSPPGRVARPSRQSLDASTSSSRVQRSLPNGAGRLVVYASGVEKELYKDGTTVVRFPNGDIETKLPDKTVAYFHAAEHVMQITQPDRSVLLEYPNGQVERHYVDGSKAILFPNGQKVKLDPSGRVLGYGK